ncbi:hypothetical protein SDC9_140077 [bioreactor metagenome]|uniref:Uncharacterized protein n=1 Tax=bioreactor metagenome TaxID=1076179 RepID=A0A645DUD3_9ZZZZ
MYRFLFGSNRIGNRYIDIEFVSAFLFRPDFGLFFFGPALLFLFSWFRSVYKEGFDLFKQRGQGHPGLIDKQDQYDRHHDYGCACPTEEVQHTMIKQPADQASRSQLLASVKQVKHQIRTRVGCFFDKIGESRNKDHTEGRGPDAKSGGAFFGINDQKDADISEQEGTKIGGHTQKPFKYRVGKPADLPRFPHNQRHEGINTGRHKHDSRDKTALPDSFFASDCFLSAGVLTVRR